MKLVFNNVEIPQDSGNVFFGGTKMWFVRFNDTLVWEKDISQQYPRSLTATKGQEAHIFVSWEMPENETPDSYNLYRDGSLYKTGITELYFDDTGLSKGERHEYYAVSVFSNGTTSESSNTDYGYTKISSGSITYTVTGKKDFVVPEGVTKLHVCMIGGGASGWGRYGWYGWNYHYWNNWNNSLGGKAGVLKEEILTIAPGSKLWIYPGRGGGTSRYAWQWGGRVGSKSIIKNNNNTSVIYANGASNQGHSGQGTVTGQSGCDKTAYPDGGRDECSWAAFGGQGTIFGKGGDGGYSGYYCRRSGWYYNGYWMSHSYCYGSWRYWNKYYGWNPQYWWNHVKDNCYAEGLSARNGQGYGAGGGSGYTYYRPWNNDYARSPGRGADGVVILSWGPEFQDFDSSQENIIESISEKLGYDVLDERFLNTIRYSTKERNLSIKDSQYIIDVDDKDFDINTFFNGTGRITLKDNNDKYKKAFV